MTNPTSNFGWQMPTSTDLVTDLPADFEVFGQAVDTSLADLKGGTTGQILSKNSNTDMDFVWTAANPGDITAVTAGTGITGGGTSGAVTITNDMATTITTNGDLIYGTGAGTYTRRGIGSTGQVLSVSGGVPTWATPAGSTLTVAQIANADTLSGTSINLTGLSSYDFLQFRFSAVSWNTGASWLKWTINNDTSALYQQQRSVFVRNTSVVMPTMAYFGGDTAINCTDSTIPMTNGQGGSRGFIITLRNCKATGFTSFDLIGNWGDSLGSEETTWISGIYKSAAAVSSFQMTTNAGYTFNAGGYTVYGG